MRTVVDKCASDLVECILLHDRMTAEDAILYAWGAAKRRRRRGRTRMTRGVKRELYVDDDEDKDVVIGENGTNHDYGGEKDDDERGARKDVENGGGGRRRSADRFECILQARGGGISREGTAYRRECRTRRGRDAAQERKR